MSTLGESPFDKRDAVHRTDDDLDAALQRLSDVVFRRVEELNAPKQEARQKPLRIWKFLFGRRVR